MLDCGAMLAKRLPLLSAFSGGCLFSAALIGYWCVDAAKRSSASNQGARDRASDALTLPSEQTNAIRNRALADDGSSRERTAQPSSELAAPDEMDHSRNAANGEPPIEPRASDKRGEPPTESGSSVADVLGHLESSYRQALAVAALSDAPSASNADRAVIPTSRSAGRNMADREPDAPQAPTVSETPAPTVTGTPPHTGPAREEAVAALADGAAPPKSPRPPDPQNAPLAAAEPPAVAPPPDDPRPRDAYVGDARPNIYVGNVGNIYQGDVYQVQQLAVLQYVQLLAPLAFAGLAAPVNIPRGMATRRSTPFPSSLTNPDNPWGFNFHPPVLVK